MPFLERELAPDAAEVDGLDRRDSSDGVSAPTTTVIPQIGSTAVVRARTRGVTATASRRRTSTSRARIESAISAARLGADVEPGGRVDLRQQLSIDAVGPGAGRAPRRRACGRRRGRRTGARLEPGLEHLELVAPVCGDDQREITVPTVRRHVDDREAELARRAGRAR